MFEDSLRFEIKIKGYTGKYHIYATDITALGQKGYFVFDQNEFCRYFPVHMVECIVVGTIPEEEND